MKIYTFRRLKNSHRGETIVAVLMAATAISFTLTLAFASTNRAYQSSQLASERFLALKVAESQLELLKNYYKNPTQKLAYDSMTAGVSFCIDGTQPEGSEIVADTSPICAGTNCSGGSGIYTVVLVPHSGGNGVFESKVTWERVGKGTALLDELSLYYRLGPL